MGKTLFSILVIAIFMLQGCGEKASLSKQLEMEKKIGELSTKLESTQTAIAEMKSQVQKASLNDMFRDWESVAFLTTGSTEYSPIKTHIGTITVSIADIQPFANGSKVTLTFGNPYSAKLNAIKFKVDYGTLDKDGVIKAGTEKSKDISLTESFNAGSWTRVRIVLEGLPVSELGYLRVHDFSNGSIGLMGRN